MSITVPTTQQLSDAIVAQLEAQFSARIPLLPKSFSRVLAKVIAGVIVILYKYACWMFLQQFVSTASIDETSIGGKAVRPLVELGRRSGVGDPDPAIAAEHIVAVTVTNQVGNLASGRKLLRTQTGVVYETAYDVALNAPTIQVTIRPVSDQDGGDGSGTIGNLAVGDTLDFAQPVTNVLRTVTVTQQTVTGADAETRDEYEARITRRTQARPQGGAYADYRQWAESSPGIANAYPYRGPPGEVDVYIEATVASYGNADGIPTADQLAQAKNAILYEDSADIATGLATRSPVNDRINTFAIRRTAFSVRIIGSVNESLRETLRQAADEYFRSIEPFLLGLSALPRRDMVTQAGISSVMEEIVSAYAGTVTSVQLIENGMIISQGRQIYTGEKCKLGTLYMPGE